MKEILQLFRRDAEHSHPVATSQFDPIKPKILKDISTSSQGSSRETSVPRDRKASPPYAAKSGSEKEDAVYGRRW